VPTSVHENARSALECGGHAAALEPIGVQANGDRFWCAKAAARPISDKAAFLSSESFK